MLTAWRGEDWPRGLRAGALIRRILAAKQTAILALISCNESRLSIPERPQGPLLVHLIHARVRRRPTSRRVPAIVPRVHDLVMSLAAKRKRVSISNVVWTLGGRGRRFVSQDWRRRARSCFCLARSLKQRYNTQMTVMSQHAPRPEESKRRQATVTTMIRLRESARNRSRAQLWRLS